MKQRLEFRYKLSWLPAPNNFSRWFFVVVDGDEVKGGNIYSTGTPLSEDGREKAKNTILESLKDIVNDDIEIEFKIS